MGATIGIACAVGTASVVIAVTSVLTGLEGVGVPLVAGPLKMAASAGKNYPRLAIEVKYTDQYANTH